MSARAAVKALSSVAQTTDKTFKTCNDNGGAFTRCAVSEPERSLKHALECLRLEADCMQLAGTVRSHSLQSHFVRMAGFWSSLALSGPSANAGQTLAAGNAQTT
jgi:DNA-binding PucR family transcriptional regulator